VAKFKRNISKIRLFVKEVFEYYHDEANSEDERHYGCSWLFGKGELHAYCSNFKEHKKNDFHANQGGNAFAETYGRWEDEALNKLRKRGWIFSKKFDVCICPTCAKANSLIEIE